jgi:PmbA protein
MRKIDFIAIKEGNHLLTKTIDFSALAKTKFLPKAFTHEKRVAVYGEREDCMNDLKIIADKALAALKAEGADMAACSVRTAETREFNVDGGEFSLYRTLFDKALNLTAYKEYKKGSIAANRFDDESIAGAAKDCLSVAASSVEDRAWDIAPETNNQSFVSGVPEPDMDYFFARIRELVDNIKERYPLIIIEQLVAEHELERAVYKNSKGAEYESLSGQYSVDIAFSAHEGEESSSFFGTSVVTDKLDKPFIELGTIACDLEDAQKQIYSKSIEGKFTGTILLHPSCLESMLDSIIDNFASDGVIIEGTSIWKDKLDTKVADDRLTVSVAPLDKRIVCGERYTGDGFISEDYDIIKEGILKSFVLSLYTSNKTGLPRAKNTDGCLVVKAGDKPLKEIIKSIKRGLIVGRFSGGDPGTGGDFSGVAKNSFLVEDGEIVSAVSESMISGNLAELLLNVEAISRELACNGSSVLPWIAFNGITVSGK